MALPLLFLAASAAKGASTIQQGRIADAEGRAQARLNERNALILEQDADARDRKTRFDQLRQVVSGAKVQGRLLAGLGASGARLDVGAPIRLLSDQAEELELDMLLIGYEGAIEARQLRNQAVIQRFQGSLAKARGKSTKETSFLQAGAGLLSDFSTAKQAGFLESGTKKKKTPSKSTSTGKKPA